MADPRFPPVQNASSRQVPGRKGGFPFLPVVLLLIYLLYAGVMLVGPEISTSLHGAIDGILDITARLAIAGVLFVLFAIIMIYDLTDKPAGGGKTASPSLKRTPAPPPGGQVKKFKPVGQAPPMGAPPKSQTRSAVPENKGPREEKEPSIIPYPKEVEGGIYADTYIELSPSKTLRIRSMVVEPDYVS